MRAKTEFNRQYVRIIHWVYKGGAEPELEETLEKQIASLLEYARICMDPELAEKVVRNALIQPASDEAVEVLANEDPGNPADYEMGPDDLAQYEKEPKMARTPKNKATEENAEATPEQKATPSGRGSKFATTTYTVTAKSNWRRPGSHGHATIQAIIDAGGVMTGADLKAAGGRPVDVAWDLKNNPDFLKAVEPEAAAAEGFEAPQPFTVDLPEKTAKEAKKPATTPEGEQAPEGETAGEPAPEGGEATE